MWFAAAGTYELSTPAVVKAVLKFGPMNDARPVENKDGSFSLAEVQAGVRNRLELTFSTKGTMSIHGDAVPTSNPVDEYMRFATAISRLRKSLDVIAALGITGGELEHVRSLPGAVSLDALPLASVDDDEAARMTFIMLLPWIDIAAARRHYGAGDRVVEVLRAAKRTYDVANQEAAFDADLHRTLSALTGWKADFIQNARKALAFETRVTPTAGMFTLEVPALTTGAGLRRMTDAVTALVRLGSNPDDLVSWSKKWIDSQVATKVRASLKGRYTPTAWRRVAQPIFDVLRKKQRDALVAHLTHLMGTPYGETQEQLFEHLLLDPGTEPPVFASRIQLAISSVQLFVQRCLMNLEEDVAPSLIDAKRWEWMRRYRVWEVNRKMFLWPENWLEPEFRDDKTHLFRDLEGALLQGDVSDDLVRTALHTYLKGLEGIARLEMMTMYFEPGASADSSTVHVIGRTPNSPRISTSTASVLTACGRRGSPWVWRSRASTWRSQYGGGACTCSG